MMVNVFNNGVVLYQTSAGDDLPNAAIVIHRDNGGTLILRQEDDEICVDLHRENIKALKAALDKVLTASEEFCRKKH